MKVERVIPAGPVKQIHVNVNSIRHNAKHADTWPVCRVQAGPSTTIYGDEVQIGGPSALVYRPTCPLACGAKVWIETTAEVLIIGVRPHGEKAPENLPAS